MNVELLKVRKSITSIERKLQEGKLSENVRALAERGLRLCQKDEEMILKRMLLAYPRPEVLQ